MPPTRQERCNELDAIGMVRGYLRNLDADAAAVESAIRDLGPSELRSFGYDGFHLNLLALFGESWGPERVAATAAAAVRSKLWRGWEFYSFLTHPERYEQIREMVSGGLGPLDEVLERGRGVILCTHHLGDYRYVPLELARRSIPLVLPLDQDAFEQTSRSFGSAAKWVAQRIELANVESGRGTVALAKAIRRGKPAFVYVDGNTGLGGPSAAEGRVELDFLGFRVAIKSGFARLAARLGTPLLPVLVPRDPTGPGSWLWGEPLDPGHRLKGSELEDFVATAVRQVYGQLQAEAERCAEQWETACFVHRWRSLAAPRAYSRRPSRDDDAVLDRWITAGQRLRLNHRRMVRLGNGAGAGLWLDVHTLQAIKVPSGLEGLFDELSGAGVGLRPEDLDRFDSAEQRSAALAFLRRLNRHGALVA